MSRTNTVFQLCFSFVPSSDPGSSDETTDGSLSDYDSSDDLSSENEREEDDLYQPLSFRLVNMPLMKTDTFCTVPNVGINVNSG